MSWCASRSRPFLSILVAQLALLSTSAAQAQMSESDVLSRARTVLPEIAHADSTNTWSHRQAQKVSPLPNPSLTWTRESLPNETEVSLVVSVPVQLGRQSGARSIAESQGAWQRVNAATMARDAILEALLHYVALARAEEEIALLNESVTDLEEASRVLSRRQEEGIASSYDRARLQIASHLARSELAEAEGKAKSARAQLAARLSLKVSALESTRGLNLVQLPRREELLKKALGENTMMTHLRSATEAALSATRKTSLAWLPSLQLSGGLRRFAATQEQFGYVFGLGIELPVFNRRQILKARASQAHARSKTRAKILTSRVRAQINGLHAEYEAARKDLARFDEGATEPIRVLLRAAKSGFAEGQQTIGELLDAQGLQTQVRKRRLELLASAKRAEAMLRASAGEFE